MLAAAPVALGAAPSALLALAWLRPYCLHTVIAMTVSTTLSNSCGILRRRSAQQQAAAASGAVKQHTCVIGQQAAPWSFAAAASKASASRSRPAAASSKPTDFTELVVRTVGMTNYNRKVCFFDIDALAEQSNMI